MSGLDDGRFAIARILLANDAPSEFVGKSQCGTCDLERLAELPIHQFDLVTMA